VHRPTRRPFERPLGGSPGVRPGVTAPVCRVGGLAGALLIVLTSAGCGPFGYLKRVASDATRAVADAEAAGAEEYAPYEYWGAVAYLEQAKVLMGYSEYERSFDFGDRAKQLANEAKIKAQRVRSGESTVHEKGIAAPDEMVDDDGDKIDSVDEVYEDKPEPEPEPEAKTKAKAGGGK
jgi:hypothetical protein